MIPVGAPHVFRPASSDTLGNRLIVYNCLFDMQMVEQLNIVLQEPSIREHLATLGSSSFHLTFPSQIEMARLSALC